MRRYLLIDGHSIIYRSYYAFIRKPLRNSKGFNTSAVYGFLNTLRSIAKRFKPEYMAVMFDTGKKTFRHDRYESYKATRKPPPDDLLPQIPIIKRLVNAMGIKVFELEGYEADDLLATFSRVLTKSGEVYIITFDKDLLQLVDDKRFVVNPYGGNLYDAESIRKIYGINPKQVVDLLAIMGDASDNIPGIPGFGPKRARKLIEKYGSIEDAIASEPKLKDYIDDIKLFKSLLTVDQEVPIEVNGEELAVKNTDEQELLTILREMEFYNFIRDFFGSETKGDYGPGRGNIKAGRYAVYVDDQIYISDKEGDARSYPLSDGNIKALKESELIGIDIKGIVKLLSGVPRDYYDVGIGVQLIRPDKQSRRFSMENTVLKFLGKAIDYMSPYQIADYTLPLASAIKKQIEELGLKRVFDLEQKLIPVIAAIEQRGICVNAERLTRLRDEVEKEKATLEFEIYRLAGQSFNINSPRQLAHILFDLLGLKPIKKKKTLYSTENSVLIKLAKEHPLPDRIIQFREKAKLISTYLDPLSKKVVGSKKRIHTTLNQLGAATGRLSSIDPNLQNIPSALRKIFVAETGYKIVSADYSQIELRILAHLSGDEKLKSAFMQGLDIHTTTAQELFGISASKVQEHHRGIAKVVNYGIIYGLTEYGLAGNLHITREEARKIIEHHQELYPETQEWIAQHIALVRENGEARTILGRRRSFSDPLTDDKIRVAINFPVQGSAADVIKLAMVRIEQRLSDQGVGRGMILQIHDELLFEIDEKKIEQAISIIREEMENTFTFDVPIKVNIGVGDDWYEAHWCTSL